MKTAAFLKSQQQTNPNRKTCLVIRLSDGLTMGSLKWIARDGWRFTPHYQSKPSRKGWSTSAKALKNYRIVLVPPPEEKND